MNQQEIFQNMTKGEWKVNPADGQTIRALNENDFSEKISVVNAAGKMAMRYKANGKAILAAVNNTYGKGINPESVEKMLEVVKRTAEYFAGTDAPTGKLAKEALTAAKLI